MTRILLLTFFLLASANAQTPQPTPLPISRSISIADFGAKGNGTTDDTKAFVAAIAEAAKTGAELRLGDGTYLLKETLQLPNAGHPFSIVGGQGTRLLFAPDHPLDSGFVIAKASGVALRSFTLHGSGAGLDHAISVVGSTNIRLDHLQIESIHGTGALALSAILLGTDDQVWITNCTFKDIGAAAGKPSFVITNYYRAHSEHIYIDHNQMSGNTASIVIGIFDTDHSVIEDNIINGGNLCVRPCGNNGYGVLLYRLGTPTAPKIVDETIIGNHISNTAGSGIYLAGVNGGKVADNTITDTTLQQDGTSLPAAGIALNGSDNIHILGNIIQRSGRCGIAISTTQDITIEGNQIRDISTWAIHLRGAQVRTAVNKNVIDGASIGISIASDTSSTTLEGNVQTRVKQPMKDLSVH
jgi:parallel beta-helix repeat protein